MTKQYLNPPTLFDAKPFGFSQIVTCPEGMVFISGQTAWNIQGQLIGDADLGAQLTAALNNVASALEAIGGAVTDVVRVRLYIVDHVPENLEIVGGVMTRFFGRDTLPASTLIGVAALAVPEFLVEVEVDVWLDRA